MVPRGKMAAALTEAAKPTRTRMRAKDIAALAEVVIQKFSVTQEGTKAVMKPFGFVKHLQYIYIYISVRPFYYSSRTGGAFDLNISANDSISWFHFYTRLNSRFRNSVLTIQDMQPYRAVYGHIVGNRTPALGALPETL